MKRTILKVIKRGTKWVVVSSDAWEDDTAKNKAIAIRRAFRHAKKASPALVRIYSATGKMQVESEW